MFSAGKGHHSLLLQRKEQFSGGFCFLSPLPQHMDALVASLLPLRHLPAPPGHARDCGNIPLPGEAAMLPPAQPLSQVAFNQPSGTSTPTQPAAKHHPEATIPSS